jgi:hypothetical protein
LTLLGLLACNGGEIKDIADQPLAGEDLVAVFPPDGAMWLVGEVPIAVVLGAGAQGTKPTIAVTHDDGSTSAADCIVQEAGNIADCGVVKVSNGDAIGLDVTAGTASATVQTLGRLPSEGVAWSMLDGMSFAALGSGGSAVSLANGFLGLGDAFLAIDGYDGTPGSWKMYGSQSIVEGDLHRVASPGLVFLLDAEVDEDGGLTATASSAWCPVWLQNGANHLLLLDVVMEGRLVGSTLTEVVITAVVPALTLEALSEPLGLFGGVLLDSVTLDVDRDGDGTFDAASVRLEGEPAPAVLVSWVPSE